MNFVVYWWKVYEENQAKKTPVERQLEAIDTFERNVLHAIKKFESRLLKKLKEKGRRDEFSRSQK